jgi:thiol-disulfide isomerase/thioredoxin
MLAACSPASADLQVGDIAPELTIDEWVQGSKVDLAKDVARKFHMIEFWAVWCPPCKASVPLLTKYQQKYADDLVIVGVTDPDTGSNSPREIRRFVKQQGPNMSYTVAMDRKGKTSAAYLPMSGVVGIPHAFIIGKDRKVLWEGSPLDPALESIIPRAIAGEYSVETARLEQKIAKMMSELDFMAQMGEWDKVWDGLIEILNLDPQNGDAMGALVITTVETNRDGKFRDWARSHIDKHKKNAPAMRRLADTLTSIADFQHRFPDLALEAARAAHGSSKKPDAGALAVYARALYQVGALDRAIALQQDAVSVATNDEREFLRGTLEYYRNCKKLQGTVE